MADFRTSDGHALWKCLCDCQKDLPEEERKYTFATKRNLEEGITTSCGCYHRETLEKVRACRHEKHNEYDLSGEYGICITKNNIKFIFDLEDYELISRFCWHNNQRNGYFSASMTSSNRQFLLSILPDPPKSSVLLHRLIMAFNLGDTFIPSLDVDHINGLKWDNRKNNLRLVSKSQNNKNAKLNCRNSSGYKGISRHHNKWYASIRSDNKQIHLGSFDNYEDALKARKEAEQQYFGEYNRAPEFLNNGKESKMGGD